MDIPPMTTRDEGVFERDGKWHIKIRIAHFFLILGPYITFETAWHEYLKLRPKSTRIAILKGVLDAATE